MAAFLVNDKLEAALVALITPAVSALTPIPAVVGGKASTDKEAPIVICDCQGEGEDDPQGTGNFWLRGEIQIKHTGVPNETGADPATADPITANEALITAVCGAVMVDDLEAQLTAAVSDFHVFSGSASFSAPVRGQDENGNWVDTIALRVYCCGSALN